MGYENNFYQQQRMSNSYPYQQGMISSGLKGRPVSSIDEARAAQIDFDGSLFIFPDIANKRIYTKQIGVDGSVILNMYESKPIPTMQIGNFITREEFEEAVNSIKQSINEKSMPVAEAAPPQEQIPQPPKPKYNF